MAAQENREPLLANATGVKVKATDDEDGRVQMMLVSSTKINQHGLKAAIACEWIAAQNDDNVNGRRDREVSKTDGSGAYYDDGGRKVEVFAVKTVDGYTVNDPTAVAPGDELTAKIRIEGSGRKCFPTNTLVTTRGPEGTVQKLIGELQQGDYVAVGSGRFSRVLLWSHRDEAAMSTFVEIVTSAGRRVRMSPGHLLPVTSRVQGAGEAGSLVPAIRVQAGDGVTLVNAQNCCAADTVEAVSMVRDGGLMNVQTECGSIVANGVLASCSTIDSALGLMRGLVRPSLRAVANLGEACRLDLLGAMFPPRATTACSRAWRTGPVGCN